MLEEFVTTERARRRYLATPVGAYIDGYLEHLSARGFATGSIRHHAQRVAAFGEYLAEHNVLTSALGEEHVDSFAERYRATPRRFGPRRRRAGHGQAIDACRACRGALPEAAFWGRIALGVGVAGLVVSLLLVVAHLRDQFSLRRGHDKPEEYRTPKWGPLQNRRGYGHR